MLQIEQNDCYIDTHKYTVHKIYTQFTDGKGQHMFTHLIMLSYVHSNTLHFITERIFHVITITNSVMYDSFLSADNIEKTQTRSKLTSTLLWLCGMEQKSADERPPPPQPEVSGCSLDEDPCMRHVVNANLIICLSMAVFLFAYWA